jgi:hypothetical protein
MSRAGVRPLTQPALPPGFRAQAVAAEPLEAACLGAASGADPGLVLHNHLGARCNFGIVLCPERSVAKPEMLALAAGAVQAALASLAPVRVPVTATPCGVAVNGARVARLRVRMDAAAVPEWLVLGIDVAVDLQQSDPGLTPDVTCLREEGFEADASGVMVAICRHLLAAIDAWRDATAVAAQAPA